MTPDFHACVGRATAAERAGDIGQALEWHRSVPVLRKGRHSALLGRLSPLGGELPDWVWARWIIYLTTRCDDGGAGELMHAVLIDLLNTAHNDLVDQCHAENGDPVRVGATVMGESWLFHQVVAHEAGGLEDFIDEHLDGRLAERTDLARSWARARMSGYEIGLSLPGARLQVREAGRSEWTEILDLGARTCSSTGWVLGRLVPSGIGDLLMFDTPPLGVSASMASRVAAADNWQYPVVDALEAGRSSRALLRADYEITSDVQELDLIRLGTRSTDLDRVMQQLRNGRDEGSRAAFRILRGARDAEVSPADQALVAAAVQFPQAFEDARRRLMHDGDAWNVWASRVAEPARRRLLALAEAPGASA